MTGYELKQSRKKAGWTQAEVAQRLGISQPYLALLEKGKRTLTPDLASRFVRTLKVSPVVLRPNSNWARKSTDEKLARCLSSLGYPGFAYLRKARKRNPAEVLLAALAQENLESRVAEALPWLLLHYADMDKVWLVQEARSRNLSNRLGFVTTLAKEVLERKGETNTKNYSSLTQLESDLTQSRLDREDTLCQSSLSNNEREFLRNRRPPEAEFWHLLTNWQPEHLQYV